ncbi:Fic family protein [Streptosporangium sp. NPDC020145]|uniref:Fic family protein n=1 Tax=Streptosporangium sp. NPDC020145 TaxID=3154694 RepID=UPI003427258D
MSTESDLRDWRGGQINAERMCASILAINDYIDIDPQAPLGGPDGKKDILAKRLGHTYVAAVYFPPTHPSFSEIRRKFINDRLGVARNKADAFIFMVNQPLLLSERSELLQLGSPLDELYHLERLRASLDSPKGYGLRLEYLRQPMAIEEQMAFFSTLQQDMANRFTANERRIESKIDAIYARTMSLLNIMGYDPGPSSINEDVVGEVSAPMASLDIATLQLLHRAITEDSPLPRAVRGQIRGVRVWIGDSENPIFIPPPPEEIPERIIKLLQWWRRAYFFTAKSADASKVIELLAKFHHEFAKIHPFLDANGRLARLVIDQAARELINRGIGGGLTQDHRLYFAAIDAANNGDLNKLKDLIRAALE